MPQSELCVASSPAAPYLYFSIGRLQAKVRRWQTPQWGDLAVGFQQGCDQPGLFFRKALAAAWENRVEVVALPWGLV